MYTVCGHVHMSAGAGSGQKRKPESQELELTLDVVGWIICKSSKRCLLLSHLSSLPNLFSSLVYAPSMGNAFSNFGSQLIYHLTGWS